MLKLRTLFFFTLCTLLCLQTECMSVTTNKNKTDREALVMAFDDPNILVVDDTDDYTAKIIGSTTYYKSKITNKIYVHSKRLTSMHSKIREKQHLYQAQQKKLALDNVCTTLVIQENTYYKSHDSGAVYNSIEALALGESELRIKPYYDFAKHESNSLHCNFCSFSCMSLSIAKEHTKKAHFDLMTQEIATFKSIPEPNGTLFVSPKGLNSYYACFGCRSIFENNACESCSQPNPASRSTETSINKMNLGFMLNQ